MAKAGQRKTLVNKQKILKKNIKYEQSEKN